MRVSSFMNVSASMNSFQPSRKHSTAVVARPGAASEAGHEPGIGRGIGNVRAYVLDEHLRAPREVAIAGDGAARVPGARLEPGEDGVVYSTLAAYPLRTP